MEKQLKCVLLLSLKEMALRMVAVSFWNDPDILISLSKRNYRASSAFGRKDWKIAVEGPIKEKITNLLLPESCKEQLTDLITPMCLQVIEWIDAHKFFLLPDSCDTVLSGRVTLCWNTTGTINYRKTAEKFIHCLRIINTQYELACCYCLEDDIPLFWEQLYEDEKMSFTKLATLSEGLPYVWPHILQGNHSGLHYLMEKYDRNLTSFYQYAFELSVKQGYKSAAAYFLPKLTHEEREVSLKRCVLTVITQACRFGYPREKPYHILYFLLTAMTPEQQVEAIKAHPAEVVYCFLQWPMQDVFFENAALFWTFIPSSSYQALLMKIIDGYMKSEFYFPKLFQEFFKQSPQEFKKYFLEGIFVLNIFPTETAAGNFLRKFFERNDSESIKIFFRTLDAVDRVQTVFQDGVLRLFYRKVLREGCDLVELCLREAVLSKEEKERFKKAFTGCIYERNRKAIEGKVKRIFDFLDETGASSKEPIRGEKRKLENCSPEL